MNKLIRFLKANNYSYLRGKDKNGCTRLIVVNVLNIVHCAKLENILNDYCFKCFKNDEYYCYYIHF